MASISNIKAMKIKNNRTFYEHRYIHQSHPLFPPVWGGDHKITYKQFQKEKKKISWHSFNAAATEQKLVKIN